MTTDQDQELRRQFAEVQDQMAHELERQHAALDRIEAAVLRRIERKVGLIETELRRRQEGGQR